MTVLSLAFCLALIAAPAAGAQQAAMPTPPKTVHPLPQSTSDCRGCSDQTDGKTTPAAQYDERKEGTVKPSVRPDVKPARIKAKKHRKHATHAKKKPARKPAPVKPAVKPKPDSLRK